MQTITYRDLMRMIIDDKEIPEVETERGLLKYRKTRHAFCNSNGFAIMKYIHFKDLDREIKIFTPIEAKQRRKEIKEEREKERRERILASQNEIMDIIKSYATSMKKLKNDLTEENIQKIEEFLQNEDF